MQGQNIIELGFDIDKLTQEKKQVLDLFVDLFGKLQTYDGSKFNPLGGGGLADLKKSIADNAKAIADLQAGYVKFNEVITDNAKKQSESKKATEDLAAAEKGATSVVFAQTASYDNLIRKSVENQRAMKDLTQAQKDLEKAYQSGEISLEQYLSSSEGIKSQQLSLKTSTAEVNQSLSLMEKQTHSTTDSQLQLENRLASLKLTYSKLSGAERDSQAGNTLLSEIQETDAAVKNINYSVGQFQRNVGNYSGSFVKAFEVLKEQLASVKSQMGGLEAKGQTVVSNLTGGNPVGFDPNRFKGQVTSLAKTGGGTAFVAPEDAAAYQASAQKAQLLEGTLERLSIGFKTTRQESRAFQEAAVDLGLAVGLESDEFRVFDKAVGESQNAINDIKAATKFQASDAKLITGLANAASTLAGGFGAAQAAVSLFRGEDEDLQKQMAKFQQLLVLINGLQAVANGLQTESGGVQLLLSARTSLLNAAKATQLLITTRAVQIVAAETAATAVNAEVKEADVIATGEQAVAEEVATGAIAQNTEATVANAAANVAAKGATGGLTTAFIAGGIAALAIGAGVALALLTAKLIGYGEQTGLTIKQQEEMAEAMKAANQVIIEQTEFIKNLDSSTLRYYQNELTYSKAAGENKYRQYAIEKQITEEEKATAQQTIDALGANNKQQGELAGTIQLLNEKKKEAIRIERQLLAIPTKDLTGDQKDQITAAKANVEFYQKQADGIKGLYDAGDKARKDLQAANLKNTTLDIDLAKFTAEEERKLTLETVKLQIEAIKDKNSRTLSDDRSTLQQRLTAIRSNAQQEKKEAQANFDALDPNATVRETQIAQAQLSAAKIKADKNAAVQEFETKRAYNDRLLEARASANRNLLESDASIQAAISSDQQKELDTRLQSLQKEIDDRTKIIVEDYNLQLKLAKEHGKTQEEQDKLTSDRDKALVALTADTQKKIYETTISYADKKLKDVEEINKAANSSNSVDEQYEAQLSALNRSLLNNKISYDKYLRDKDRLDKDYTEKKDAAEVADDKASLDRLKKAEADQIQVKLDAAKIQLDAAKAGGDETEIKNAQAKYDALLSGKHKFDADINAANEKANKDEIKLENDKIERIRAAEEKLKQNKKEILVESYNLAKNLVDASYENEINRIQARIDLQDQQSNAEIAAIGRSTLSQRQQTEEAIILTAQQTARDKQAKKEQLDLKIKEAKFDRDVAVAEIAWNTAKAIMKDTAGVPFPLSLGVALSDAALGAIQAAIVLSKPIPTYAEGIGIPGKGQHPGGLAWVGEEYTPEEIKMPGRAPFIVDKPTLLDMPGGSSVTPLEMQDIIYDIGWGAIARGAAIVNSIVMDSGSEQIVGALEKHGARMERALRRSQRKMVNIIKINTDNNGLSQHYIDTKILGKR